MPNCVQLIRKGETEPTKLAQIDDEICAHFKVEPHPTRWYAGWFDYIGFCLSLGQSFEKIEKNIVEEVEMVRTAEEISDTQAQWKRMLEILVWLEARFTARAWYETK